MSKQFIDIFSEDEDIIKYQKQRKINFEFVNIIEFCKNKYSLSVIELSKIFGVHRQTIYNFLNHERDTKSLEKSTKDILINIYEVRTFEEVLTMEKDLLLKADQEYRDFNMYENPSMEFYDMLTYHECDRHYMQVYPNICKLVILEKYNIHKKFNDYLHFVNEEKHYNDEWDNLKLHVNSFEPQYRSRLIKFMSNIPINDDQIITKLEQTVGIVSLVKISNYNDLDLINISSSSKYIIEAERERFTKYYSADLTRIDLIINKIKDDNLLYELVILEFSSGKQLINSLINKVKDQIGKLFGESNKPNIIIGQNVIKESNEEKIGIYLFGDKDISNITE